MITTARYHVRTMTEADISQVAGIEHESFPTTWPQTAYKRELSNNLARYLVLVDRIVAIAVREAYRGLGLGEVLLAEAIDLAIEHDQDSVTLEVRKSNLVAQRLYEKYRFLKVGTRKRYYSDNHEDAIVMTTPPIQDAIYAEHLAYLRETWQKRWDS